MADVTARDGSASDYRYHARAIIAALKHHEHCYPFLGIASHIADLDRCAKSLGIPVPIELEGPSSIEMANQPASNANRECFMGGCTIRFPGGDEEVGRAAKVLGIEPAYLSSSPGLGIMLHDSHLPR